MVLLFDSRISEERKVSGKRSLTGGTALGRPQSETQVCVPSRLRGDIALGLAASSHPAGQDPRARPGHTREPYPHHPLIL